MFECKTEWDYLTKWDGKALYVQSAKGEIESFRAGRAHWGISSFPLNRGSESLISLAALPETFVCVSACVLYTLERALGCAWYICVHCYASPVGGTRHKEAIVVCVKE